MATVLSLIRAPPSYKRHIDIKFFLAYEEAPIRL